MESEGRQGYLQSRAPVFLFALTGKISNRMIIRRQQLDAFAQAAVSDFEKRMCVHLWRFFPGRCAALGENAVVELVRAGIQAGKRYTILTERDVARYIDLAAQLEGGADIGHEHSWAREILVADGEARRRIDRLYAVALRGDAGREGEN
jgi:hypothetical protein